MRARWGAAAVLGLGLLGGLGDAGSPPALDRPERFGELGRRLLEVPEPPSSATGSAREALFDLVDAEVLDNLRADGPFATPAFILERLQAFAEAWGGAAFQAQRLTAPRGEPPFLVVAVSLIGPPPSGSLRVYGGPPSGPRLVHAETRAPGPRLGEWPPSPAGDPQFVVTWDDPAAAGRSRPVDIAVWRLVGARPPSLVWPGPGEGADWSGVRALSIRRGDIGVRYEMRYPGWKPGCEGQTEQEDVYRAHAGGGVVLAQRRVANGWHRELGSTVARLFAAVEQGDRRTLGRLVPDPSVRRRLPATMRPEAACDAPGDRPGTVVVAATAGERSPWSLTWRRETGGWRLTAAGPVLQ